MCLYAINCRQIDREYRLKKREEVLSGINKIKSEKEEFETRKKAVLENGEEWTEGDFPQVVPNDPPMEVDNDIE